MNIFAIKIIFYHDCKTTIYNKIHDKIMVIYSIFVKISPRGGVKEGLPASMPPPDLNEIGPPQARLFLRF